MSNVARLPMYKTKSKNFPPIHLNNSICIFVREILKEIETISLSSRSDTVNLNQQQRQAIKELMDLPNVIIKPFDKGSNIILLDMTQYRDAGMCLKILRNKSWYRHMSFQEVSSYKLDFLN